MKTSSRGLGLVGASSQGFFAKHGLEVTTTVPPACSTVMITSGVGRCSVGCMSVGMPRPSSMTVIELS